MTILPYLPWITANPPALPKLYFGAISQEQRLAAICKKLGGMEAYLKYLSESISGLSEEIRTEVQAIIDELEAELDDAMSALNSEVRRQIEELREWVQRQTWATSTWDVTRGLADNSVEVMRNTFFDVTVFGTTVDDLAESDVYQTVDALAMSGWNTRALAVIGARVLDRIADNSPWIVSGDGGIDGTVFDPVHLSEAVINDNGFVVVGP